MKFVLLIFKNVRRNLVLSTLTSLGTMVLVLVVTLVWSILAFLNKATEEKKNNLKAIVTERWQIPSQMPFTYAATLEEGAAREPGDLKPLDSMTWGFYGATLDPKSTAPEHRFFSIVLQPRKLRTMMDDLDTLPADKAVDLEAAIAKMEQNRQGIIVGQDRLQMLNKRIGERIKLFGTNYKDIDLEVEIVGTFPPGRYDGTSAMNRDYLLAALDAYERDHKGQKHRMANRCLNLVWLRVPDTAAFQKIAEQIETSPYYASPSVKCETASSGIANFLDAYRDLIWGMRWFLAPAALISVALVISNAISISVRQRRMELAVMKVLGFRPSQILFLVLGESLVLGVGSGLLSGSLTWWIVNNVFGGIKFPIAFFPSFVISDDALWWGPLVGGLAALLGSAWPAWSACSVKVSDVFAKVA